MIGALAIALRTRGDWLAMLLKICAPVLAHGAAGTLKTAMPVEAPVGGEGRRAFAHLEACARTLAGLAPWLECSGLAGEEADAQARARRQAQALLASITDPASPDYLNFAEGQQPLVDAAFLAQAILRAPTTLWNELPGPVCANIVAALAATRTIAPPQNNWLLFPAMIESFFAVIDRACDRTRIDHAFARMDQCYVGDGWYADGASFHFDYYNSYVIHPMLIDMLRVLPREDERADFGRRVVARAQRHAVQIERMIAPDGTMPAIGRSLTYRAGNLHLLAQLALLHRLPPELPPGQARTALALATARSLSAPGTFDAQGWLTVGHGGHQPSLAEDYISTGSLYLATAAFLPLGLPPDDAFWTAEAAAITSVRLYDGGEVSPDRPVF
ncbi:MAG: DUF2264 domain-containing protein [Sphingopyxis sp.]|nr:DUF2264 domain-containing protein [Sphingopyxis sp.]